MVNNEWSATTMPVALSNRFYQLSPGEQCQDCRIERVLARTDMSDIYLVRDSSGRSRVLKIAPRFFPELPVSHEADVMRSYGQYRWLPRLYRSWEEKECLLLLMDYIPGLNLHEYLRACPRPLSQEKIRWILCEALRILRYLHTRPRPIFHLDIKGSQFIIQGGGLHLLDFGLAIVEGGPRWHRQESGTCVGTLGFVAPEQIRTDRNCLDQRADIYAVGVIGHCLVTGRRPLPEWMWTSPPPLLEAETEYSPRLIEAINRAIKADPKDRWQSAAQFLWWLECL